MEKDKDAAATKHLAQTLFGTAMLESGFALDNPQEFNKRVHSILATSMGLKGSMDVDVARPPTPRATSVPRPLDG